MKRAFLHIKSQKGVGILEAVISMGIVGFLVVVISNNLIAYNKAKTEAVNSKIFKDVRMMVASTVTEATRMYLSKNCGSWGWGLSGSFAKFNALGKEKYKAFNKMSFNDFMINSDYGYALSIERPMSYTYTDPRKVDTKGIMKDAVRRCNSYSQDIGGRSQEAHFCYEFGMRSPSDSIKGNSILRRNGLLEFKLEFQDMVTGDPIDCNRVAGNPRAGVLVKQIIYWTSELWVKRNVESFYLGR